MVAASSAVSLTAGPGPGPTAEASMSLPLAAKPAADMSPAKSCAVGAGQKALAPTLQSSKGNPRCQRPTPTRKTANLGPTQEAFVGQCWGHSTKKRNAAKQKKMWWAALAPRIPAAALLRRVVAPEAMPLKAGLSAHGAAGSSKGDIGSGPRVVPQQVRHSGAQRLRYHENH